MPIRRTPRNDGVEDAYIYRALRDGEIRLFKLAPALTHDAPIDVELFSCSLDAAYLPKFETISYVWGDSEDKAEIICEGKRFRIPKNLSDALLYLRNRYQPRILWTDSISINQSNVEERTTQVDLMATINWQAARSNIWVGPHLPSTKSAFELLSKLREARNAVFQDSIVPGLQGTLGFNQLEAYRKKIPTPTSSDWKSLEELLDARLLTRQVPRVWIVPDIISSKNPVLCCGMEMPWAHVCYGLETYALYSHPNVIKSPGLQTILQLERLRLCYCEGKGKLLTLDVHLDVTRSLGASNMRDKIFASYDSFQLAAPEAALWPDYASEIHVVYSTLARTLNSGGFFGPFLAPFSMMEDNESREPDSKLLSWMPGVRSDWSKPLNRYRLNQQKCDFKTSGDITSEVPQERHQDLFSEVELFDGLMIDRVGKVSSFLPPRRMYDKFNASGANAFFFLEWYEWAEENALRNYKGDRDRLLLHWIETVQAKGCDVWRDPAWADSAQLLSQVQTWLKYLEDEEQEQTEQIRQLHAAALPSHGRRFAITTRGNFCLVPRGTQSNDAVCILYGAKVPFILREGEMKSKKVAENWRNVGECYVHGAMFGEALKWEGVQQMTFDIR